jgi:YggT family protein
MNPDSATEDALRTLAAQAPQAIGHPTVDMLVRGAVGVVLTLYMMAILLRWTGSWLELDNGAWWMRVVARITDPLITGIRRVLPPMGPVDWGPIAALVVVWLVRIVVARY